MRGRYAVVMRMCVALVVIVLGACGPGVESTETGNEGSGSGESTTTGAPSCEMYDDAADIGPRVSVSVRHEGTTPVFFRPHGCGGAITIAIRENGADVPWLVDSECTPSTCQGFVEQGDCSVGCNDCAPPQAGRIDAGAMGDATWPGNITTELALDDACAAAADCPATCVRRDQAAAGMYEVALTVYRTCTGTCECDGPGPGVCGLWSGDEQLADEVTFTAALDYPTQTSVELVITD